MKAVRLWIPCLPIALVLGWWLYDLQFQWRALAEYQFGWIVPLLSAYLVWERWPGIPAEDRPASFWLCSALVCAGTPCVLVAELHKQAIASTPAASFCLSIGCLFFLAAHLLYLRGWATLRHFLFPIAFLFVAVPLPGVLWGPVVRGLQTFVTLLNVETLTLLGIPALQQANVIRLPHCVVGVDEACSGVRSLQSSIMAGLFIGNLLLKRMSSQWIFLIAGVGLAMLGNFLRSLILSVTAHRHGLQALDRLHDAAGWSVFAFTTVGLVLLAWFVTRLETRLET